MLKDLGEPVHPDDDQPPLEWEGAFWDWYVLLQPAVLYRTEHDQVSGPFGRQTVSYEAPYALDRAAWMPIIANEGWDLRLALQLLNALEAALYGKLPTQDYDENSDGE